VLIFVLYCGLGISQTSTPKQDNCIPPSIVFLVYRQMTMMTIAEGVGVEGFSNLRSENKVIAII
jgi:hypothetical protein